MHSKPTEDCDMGSFIYSNPNPIKFVNLSPGKIWEHPKKTLEEFSLSWTDEIEERLPLRMHPLPYTFFCPMFLEGHGL